MAVSARADEGVGPYECPGQRVAKRNARKEALVKCVLATRPNLRIRAAGIRCQVSAALRRARRGAIANPQAPSHADPRI